MPNFQPFPLTRGGHRQTLLGAFLRRRLRWTPPAEDLVVEVEPDVRVLVRATWQPGARADRPLLLLVHGLGGSDASTHVLATGLHAHAAGWHVARLNLRGAGDALDVCPRLYNAGQDGDLVAVLARLARETPRLAVAGFSLGANLTLVTAGRSAARLPPEVRAFAAVSPPLDLGACADALDRPANRFYQGRFMRELQEGFRERQRRRPDLYAEGRERGTRSVRDYDDAVTAFYGGFTGADDYYARSSAGPHLTKIDRPTLLLTAADDPMIPVESVLKYAASDAVVREILPTGGHVGFAGRTPAPGRFWAAERVLEFLHVAIV